MLIKLPRSDIAKDMPTEHGRRRATRNLQPQQGRLQIVPMALTTPESTEDPSPQHLEVTPIGDIHAAVLRKRPKENRVFKWRDLEPINLGRHFEDRRHMDEGC